MYLNEKLYKIITSQVPILCVDGVIMKDDRYLLVKRKNHPLKGRWWVPGGRVHRGEKLEAALKRKMLEETGLNVIINAQLGFHEGIFKKNELGIDFVHTVSVVFVASLAKNQKINLDEQSSSHKWSLTLPKSFREQMFKLNYDVSYDL